MPTDLVPGGITVPRTLEILIFPTIGGDRSLRPHVIDHWLKESGMLRMFKPKKIPLIRLPAVTGRYGY